MCHYVQEVKIIAPHILEILLFIKEPCNLIGQEHWDLTQGQELCQI